LAAFADGQAFRADDRDVGQADEAEDGAQVPDAIAFQLAAKGFTSVATDHAQKAERKPTCMAVRTKISKVSIWIRDLPERGLKTVD
jgi:hypothetical protein